MSNVTKIRPHQDIPAMLRQWANDLESGAEPMPRTLYLVPVNDSQSPPELAQFGQEPSRLEEIGIFTALASLSMRMELAPEDG